MSRAPQAHAAIGRLFDCGDRGLHWKSSSSSCAKVSAIASYEPRAASRASFVGWRSRMTSSVSPARCANRRNAPAWAFASDFRTTASNAPRAMRYHDKRRASPASAKADIPTLARQFIGRDSNGMARRCGARSCASRSHSHALSTCRDRTLSRAIDRANR